MNNRVGVIGASGDLGTQLVTRLKEHAVPVYEYSRSTAAASLVRLANECAIIHVCAPVEALQAFPKTNAIIVLHDSVMYTSRQASKKYLGGTAAVVHMLMNEAKTVVIASDMPFSDKIAAHFSDIGLVPRLMTVDEHDYMIARSQAPLALLCKTLLPYLYEQADKGFLTPSGQLLADTLRSRELTWTDATVRSILQNPQLLPLIHDMESVINHYQGVTHETFN